MSEASKASGDESAFPWQDPQERSNHSHGMTKREMISMHVYGELISAGLRVGSNLEDLIDEASKDAKFAADALLEALS